MMMLAQSSSMQMTFWLCLALGYTTIVNATLMKGEIKTNSLNNFAIRGSRRSLQMDQVGCPKEYSLLHCSDPSVTYEISCDWNTCLWDVTEFDPKSPPTSCVGVSIDDPHLSGLADVVRLCAIWSLMYGEHQSVSPTVSCKFDFFRCMISIVQFCVFRF